VPTKNSRLRREEKDKSCTCDPVHARNDDDSMSSSSSTTRYLFPKEREALTII
jgi:hypothetical protein